MLRLGVLHLERDHARALALAAARVERHFHLGDDVLAIGPLGQLEIEDVLARLVALEHAQRRHHVPLFRLRALDFVDFRHHHADALDGHVLHGTQVQLDVHEADRRQAGELLVEDLGGGFLLVDVDVVPLAFGDLGKVLDEPGVPFGADAHQGEVHLLLAGLLGELPAHLLAGRLAVREDDDLRQRALAHRLLDRVHAVLDAFVHRGAARIDVEHVDGVDGGLDFFLLGDLDGFEDGLGVVGEGDDGDAVFGLELGDGFLHGVLDALESADAGAVFLIHGAADVDDQGQVKPHASHSIARRDQLEQGVAGGALALDRNGTAVHHSFDVNLGRHRGEPRVKDVVAPELASRTGPGTEHTRGAAAQAAPS